MQKIKEQITQKEHILDADKEGFLHLMNRRYLRHFSLFGKEGQDALLHSGILVIGAGGIGCSVLYNIAAAGIGKIGIIDPGTTKCGIGPCYQDKVARRGIRLFDLRNEKFLKNLWRSAKACQLGQKHFLLLLNYDM